jgi:hypothetical protein
LAGCEEPPPPADCPELCKRRAHRARENCLADGGSEEECQAKFREVLENCLAGCEEPPPPADCPELCRRRAHEVRESCLAGGGTEEECQARFQKVLENSAGKLPCRRRNRRRVSGQIPESPGRLPSRMRRASAAA